MKYRSLTVMAVLGLLLLVACGPPAAMIAAREQAVASQEETAQAHSDACRNERVAAETVMREALAAERQSDWERAETSYHLAHKLYRVVRLCVQQSK